MQHIICDLQFLSGILSYNASYALLSGHNPAPKLNILTASEPFLEIFALGLERWLRDPATYKEREEHALFVPLRTVRWSKPTSRGISSIDCIASNWELLLLGD
jgi:hypothetical protein